MRTGRALQQRPRGETNEVSSGHRLSARLHVGLGRCDGPSLGWVPREDTVCEGVSQRLAWNQGAE